MEVQRQILLFFSSIQNPFFNVLVQGITLFGEELVQIAIVMAVFWCMDKKKGFAAALALLAENSVLNAVKAIVRFPRPWTVYPELNSLRKETATGYSFPSGHTGSAAALYGSMAVLFRKRVLSIICAVLILLVGLSRLYLCVHWPLDVAGGLLLGMACALILARKFYSMADKPEKLLPVLRWGGVAALAVSLALAILVQTGVAEEILFTDLYKALAMLGAAMLSYSIEEKSCNFKTGGSTGRKILRYIAGMAVASLLLVGLKYALPYLPVFSFIRYALTATWCCLLYPMLGKKLHLFD